MPARLRAALAPLLLLALACSGLSPSVPVRALRVSDITSGAGAYDGQEVTLQGLITSSIATELVWGEDGQLSGWSMQGPVCTARACATGDHCCNTCDNQLALDGKIRLTGPGIGCSDDACAPTCTPPLGSTQILTGVLRVGPELALEVTSIAPASP